MDYLGYALGALTGLCLGALGGGGAILTIPILVYVFGKNPVVASSQSLFIVGATALLSSRKYFSSGMVRIKEALIFVVPSSIGVILSRRVILPHIPEVIHIGLLELQKGDLLMFLFAVFMLAAAVAMVKKPDLSRVKERSPYYVGAIALVVGALAGLFGAGGGFMIVPALVLLVGIPAREAIGTSLFIVFIQSMSGFIFDENSSQDWVFLGIFTTITSVFAIIGSEISSKVSEIKLRYSFAIFVALIGSGILVKSLLDLP